MHCLDELEYYNLIKIERSKKDPKCKKFSLNVELSELIKELERINNPVVDRIEKESEGEEKKEEEANEGTLN